MDFKKIDEGVYAIVPKPNPFRDHLRERGFYDARPHAWIDGPTQLVTFPLWTPDGILVGYQKYDWRQPKLRSNLGRYFTWISPNHRPYGIWGTEYIVQRKDEPLFITEGIWDAIRVLGTGYRACAVLTATPNKQFRAWFDFITMGQNTIVLADNDDNNAGEALKKLGQTAHTVEGGKDMNSLSPAECRDFIKEILG